MSEHKCPQEGNTCPARTHFLFQYFRVCFQKHSVIIHMICAVMFESILKHNIDE